MIQATSGQDGTVRMRLEDVDLTGKWKLLTHRQLCHFFFQNVGLFSNVAHNKRNISA